MNTSNERIVMGIDPGYAILGYAVVAAQGNELRMLDCGVITTPAGLVLPERLQQIYQQLSALVDEYRPQEAAMEELFFRQKCDHGHRCRSCTWCSDAGAGQCWHRYQRIQAERSEARGDRIRRSEEGAGRRDGAAPAASPVHSAAR